MTVRKDIRRGAIFACAVLAVLFVGKLISGEDRVPSQNNSNLESGYGSFSMARKNYASQKKQAGGNISAADAQKYEKVATIGQSTQDFDADRAKIESLISSASALTQYEQQQGLSGHRSLQLGIGVPPSQFDTFIADARKIAKVTYLAIVKTDKTNEYRQLRAKKETLEKTRKAFADMAASGGSVDERLKVQAQLTEVEEKLQDLGVTLGDFNSENEFCTVKLTLSEAWHAEGSFAAVARLPCPHLDHRVFPVFGLRLRAGRTGAVARDAGRGRLGEGLDADRERVSARRS